MWQNGDGEGEDGRWQGRALMRMDDGEDKRWRGQEVEMINKHTSRYEQARSGPRLPHDHDHTEETRRGTGLICLAFNEARRGVFMCRRYR
jgi:hypothetical protein